MRPDHRNGRGLWVFYRVRTGVGERFGVYDRSEHRLQGDSGPRKRGTPSRRTPLRRRKKASHQVRSCLERAWNGWHVSCLLAVLPPLIQSRETENRPSTGLGLFLDHITSYLHTLLLSRSPGSARRNRHRGNRKSLTWLRCTRTKPHRYKCFYYRHLPLYQPRVPGNFLPPCSTPGSLPWGNPCTCHRA